MRNFPGGLIATFCVLGGVGIVSPVATAEQVCCKVYNHHEFRTKEACIGDPFGSVMPNIANCLSQPPPDPPEEPPPNSPNGEPPDPNVFRFPSIGNVLEENIAWVSSPHGDGAGSQSLGTDLSAKQNNVFNWNKLRSGDGSNNSDYVAFGLPVYAMSDGVVEECWRNAPNNPDPPDWHDAYRDGLMPHGGNELWVRLHDGSRVLYAHLNQGTIPGRLCPFNNWLFDAPGQSIVVPQNQRAQIKIGDFLGCVGNSGKSSAPHLHVHHELDSTTPAPMRIYDALTSTDGGKVWTRWVGEQWPAPDVLIKPRFFGPKPDLPSPCAN